MGEEACRRGTFPPGLMPRIPSCPVAGALLVAPSLNLLHAARKASCIGPSGRVALRVTHARAHRPPFFLMYSLFMFTEKNLLLVSEFFEPNTSLAVDRSIVSRGEHAP
jgi:hypothetical protein